MSTDIIINKRKQIEVFSFLVLFLCRFVKLPESLGFFVSSFSWSSFFRIPSLIFEWHAQLRVPMLLSLGRQQEIAWAIVSDIRVLEMRGLRIDMDTSK